MPGSHDQPSEDDAELDVPSVSAEVVAHACIAVVGGKEQGRLFQLTQRESVIGRAPSAQIRIDDGAISTQHARLSWDGELHWLEDLNSTNGTFLNGERLEPGKPVSLALNDTIQVADIVLAYLPSREEGHAQTQQLAVIAPQLPNSTALRLPDPQLIAQLLHSGAPAEPVQRPATLEEQIDKAMKVWAFVRRNWVPLFATTALCALLANAFVFISPPPTEASMKMRLNLKQPSDGLTQQRPPGRDEITQFFATAEQNFESPSLVESTLTTLSKGKRPSRQVVSDTLSSLSLDSVAFGTFEGTFTHGDPEYAFRFLNTHLKNFLDTEISRTIRGIQAEVDFISGRLKDNEDELKKTEEELKFFKAKHIDGLPDYAGEHFANREALATRRAELSAQLEKTNLELQLARKRLNEEAPLAARRVEGALPYEESLVEVKRKLGEAQARGLGPQHPEVVALQRQTEELKRLAENARNTDASRLERDANPGLLELRRRVGDLEVASKGTAAELGAIGGQLSRIDTIFKTMPEVEAKYAQLTRSYNSNRELHDRLFERLRTSQIQLELERSSAKARYEIIAPVESSGVPLRKALLTKTALGVAVGLILGFTLAVVLELRRFMKSRRRKPGTAMVRASNTSALQR